MSEAPVGEAGGWLVRHQREHCSGESAASTFQGLIVDEFVLPQSAADHADPAQIVLAANAWVDALLNQAFFIPGEFAPEALWSYYVCDYLTQMKSGGHAAYYANRGADEIAIGCTRAGLKSMLADPHLDLFELMLHLKRAKPADARRAAARHGYRSAAAALRDLDARFAALDAKEPLTPRHKMWLKSLRKLSIVADAEMNQHLQRIAGVNRLMVQRRQEAAKLRAERAQSDPAFRIARALCDSAGLRFDGMRSVGFSSLRAVWPQGPERTACGFRVETDRGPRAAMFYEERGLFKRRTVVLLEENGAAPLASRTLSKEDYAAIVPALR